MSDREALAMPSFDEMDDFAPRPGARAAVVTPVPGPASGPAPMATSQEGQGAALQMPQDEPAAPPSSRAAATKRAIDAVSHFPSREAAADAQLNLKGPRPVLDRFRAMCKADRRSYYDMLEILMDRFEATS